MQKEIIVRFASLLSRIVGRGSHRHHDVCTSYEEMYLFFCDLMEVQFLAAK